MKNSKSYTGTAVAIAWPETLCKQPGSWYEGITSFFGFNVNHYYKVGHAALLLIDHDKKESHYYDFGRYHSPFQHGRVRSAVTDHDLQINSPINIKHNEVVNLQDVLGELSCNQSCHGEGRLVASHAPINFERAHKKATSLQKASPIPYGPFVRKGTNCSRFVNTVLLAGNLKLWQQILLKLSISPTPMWNIKSLGNPITLHKSNQEITKPILLTLSSIQQ